jgi:hypothetical protein
VVKAVLHGDQEKVNNVLYAKPLLLQTTGSAVDYSGRYFSGTAFQAALATGDVEIADMVKKHFDLQSHDTSMIKQQYNVIFPQECGGIDGHLAKQAQNVFDFTAINTAIKEALLEDVLKVLALQDNDSTLYRSLHKFRQAFTQHSHREPVFNPLHLIDAYALYDTTWEVTPATDFNNYAKRALFWRHILGFVQRFLPACDAQVFAYGLYDIFKNKHVNPRSFKFKYDPGNAFYPLLDAGSGIGYELGAVSGSGRFAPYCLLRGGSRSMYEAYVAQKNQVWRSYEDLWQKKSSPGTQHSYGGYHFTVPMIGTTGICFTPETYPVTSLSQDSIILHELHSVWDIAKFNIPRTPLAIGDVSDRTPFERQVLRVLDMPIKLAGSNEYKIPDEITPFLGTIQQIINYEHSILTPEQLRSYHAYITIDQSYVEAGSFQRKPGAHVDGFQGARIHPKTIINHSYVVSNGTPTLYYSHAFNFSPLDERIHDCFLEMDIQANNANSMNTNHYTIYLMDAYNVHRATAATVKCFRTFLRISYDVKMFDRLGNTRNNMFDYQWNMVPREVQSTLIPYQQPSDAEMMLISNFSQNTLCAYLEKLKLTNLQHYYNFATTGIKTGNIDVVAAVLSNLSSLAVPGIQALRLIYIAATLSHANLAHLGKITLTDYVPKAAKHLNPILLLDYILEMITQTPNILPRKILITLIQGHEHTSQAKDIIKLTGLLLDTKHGNHSANIHTLWNGHSCHQADENNEVTSNKAKP